MEKLLNLHIQKLPEGVYLATSDDLPGLVAQGRTVTETLEIARDVARKLIEVQIQDSEPDYLEPIAQFNYPLVVGQQSINGQISWFSYRQIIKIIKSFGFVFYRQAARSNEIQFNPKTNRYTTIPNHSGDMPEGTLRAILKQAGIAPEEFLKHSS